MEGTPWGGLFCVLTDESVSVGGGLRGSSICKANMAARPLPNHKNRLSSTDRLGSVGDCFAGRRGADPYRGLENFFGLSLNPCRGDSRIARPIRCSIFDRRMGSVGYCF